MLNQQTLKRYTGVDVQYWFKLFCGLWRNVTYYWCCEPGDVQCNIPVRVIIKPSLCVFKLPLLVSKGPHDITVYLSC